MKISKWFHLISCSSVDNNLDFSLGKWAQLGTQNVDTWYEFRKCEIINFFCAKDKKRDSHISKETEKVQRRWKYSFADKQRFRQTVQNFSPNVHFAPNLMKGDPDQSFKSFKILINPSKSANPDQFANLPPQPGPRRSEILRLWKLFKSLHILHNFMWVSRFRSDGTLQRAAAKISCIFILSQ